LFYKHIKKDSDYNGIRGRNVFSAVHNEKIYLIHDHKDKKKNKGADLFILNSGQL